MKKNEYIKEIAERLLIARNIAPAAAVNYAVEFADLMESRGVVEFGGSQFEEKINNIALENLRRNLRTIPGMDPEKWRMYEHDEMWQGISRLPNPEPEPAPVEKESPWKTATGMTLPLEGQKIQIRKTGATNTFYFYGDGAGNFFIEECVFGSSVPWLCACECDAQWRPAPVETETAPDKPAPRGESHVITRAISLLENAGYSVIEWFPASKPVKVEIRPMPGNYHRGTCVMHGIDDYYPLLEYVEDVNKKAIIPDGHVWCYSPKIPKKPTNP